MGGAYFSDIWYLTPAFSILGHGSTPLGGGKTMATNSFPSMTVNQQNGYIYIAVTERVSTTDNSTNVYFYKSTDEGATWSSRQLINQVTTYDQYFPWIACDEISGSLVCIFYDSRDDNSEVNTYVAVSYDGGSTWEEGLLSDDTWSGDTYPGFEANGYAGDYIGIDARYCQCVPVWADSRNDHLLSYTSPFDIQCPYDLALCKATIREEAMYSVQHNITVAGGSSCDYLVKSNYPSTREGRCVMEAGNLIQISEGFHAEDDSYFHAFIHEDCETFCQKTTEFVRSAARVRDNPLKQALTGKYPQDSGSSEQTPQMITMRTFPNPATDRFILQYELPLAKSTVSIRIVNALGMEVIPSLNYRQAGGQYAIEIDASDWQTGTYTIIIQNENSASKSRFIIAH